MGKLYDMLREDYRVREGLKTCINCGTCTAIVLLQNSTDTILAR